MSNEFEQPVEPMSRTEDLLRTGTEEPVIAMSRIEKILRGEKIIPQSRIEDLLLKYNPSDILIEKSITENGTYYARIDNADGYYKVVVDTPVAPEPHLAARTIQNNGLFRSDVDGLDGYSNVVVNVANNAINYEQLNVTQNGVYTPSSSSIEIFGLADGIPEEVETKVYAAGIRVTSKDNLTIECYDKVSHTGVTATINTSSIANKATPQSLREKTLIICEDADHYVYLTKTNRYLWVIQKGYTFDGQSFELEDNASAFNVVNVNLPDGTNIEY